jgi:hypothetical protein
MRFINFLLPLFLASVTLAVPTEKPTDLVERNFGGSVDVLSVVTTLKSSVVSPDSLCPESAPPSPVTLHDTSNPIPHCLLVPVAQTPSSMLPFLPPRR